MKFLCVPCDSPMKLQTIAPPDRGSLSIVYCLPRVRLRDGDAHQRLRNAGRPVARRANRPRNRRPGRAAVRQVPVLRDDSGKRTVPSRRRGRIEAGEPIAVRWTAAAEARLANIPAFVRPMARTGIESFARERGVLEVDETHPRRRPASSSACDGRPTMSLPPMAPGRSPGPTSSPGTSPTAATSPASTATSTPAAHRWSARRTSPTAASSAPRSASRSSTKSPRSRLSA